MSKPPLGVLLPVYNAAETLDAALRAVAGQTFGDFIVVAVDDGSNDASAQVLDEWARRDSRFRPLHRPHEGLVASLNAGLALIDTPLVARMDADDLILPARFESQVLWMRESPGATLVGCCYDILSAGEPAAGSILYRDWQNALITDADIRREMFVESPFAHPSVMFRREAVARLGGYRETGWPEDYDLWLRMANAGSVFAKLPERLLLWRDSPGRLTWTDSRYSQEAFARCKAHHLARGPLAGRPGILVGGAGIAGARLGRALLAEGVEILAFLEVDPRKIGGTKRDRPVLSWDDGLARYRGSFVVVSVGSRGARHDVRAYLDERGLVETRDYLCAA